MSLADKHTAPDAASPSAPPPAGPLRIGGVELRSRVIPAPMCNISDRAFRSLTRDMGAHLVTTQMISCEGLTRDDPKSLALLDIAGEEPPVAVQLLGSDPDRLAHAAQMLEERGATIVDFNMGCPARKVTGNDCGSALMRDPELAARIVRAVSRAISVPFTVKMRAGWDDADISAIELARRCEGEGAMAVTLHARTRQQGYKGSADWTLIARLKEALGVPVIGNGDVTSPAHAVRMLRETGCDAVMIGRGLIGNPWLFRACEAAIADYIAGRIRHESEVPGDEVVLVDDGGVRAPLRLPHYMKDVTLDERLNLVLAHTRLMADAKGEHRGVLEMRKHSAQYIKGIPGCKALREKLMQVDTLAGVEALMEEYRRQLAAPKQV